MRRLLAPLAIFVLGCGAGRGNNGSPQAQQDAAVASLDSGPDAPLPPNTPAEAGADARSVMGGGDNTGPTFVAVTVLRFVPLDVTTSAGPVVPGVVLDTNGPGLSDTLIADVLSKLSLRTWPEYAEVQVTKTVHSADAGQVFPGVSLNPVVPLEDRWYVVRLESIPAGVTLPAAASFVMLPDGAFGARFRAGSDPVLWGIEMCNSNGQGYKVRLLFSERITTKVDVGTVVTVSQPGTTPTCTVTSSPAWPNGDDSVVALACSPIDASASVSVALGVGIESITGKQVAPSAHSFTPRDLPFIEIGCGAYRP